MPLYEYRCKVCGAQLEKIQKFSDRSLTKCPECGGKLERLLSSPAIQFKGTGWYVTDYAHKSSAAGKSGGAGSDKTDGASFEKATSPASGDTTKKKETAPTLTNSESKTKNPK